VKWWGFIIDDLIKWGIAKCSFFCLESCPATLWQMLENGGAAWVSENEF
jgi:hypothetical protein